MFKRENRLVSSTRFGKSYSVSLPQFVLREKKNGLLINRFGVIVSKKIDKRAVVRNKIKRLFREALMILNKKMKQGHDLLFVIRPEIITKTKEESKEAIESALEKAELIK